MAKKNSEKKDVAKETARKGHGDGAKADKRGAKSRAEPLSSKDYDREL